MRNSYSSWEVGGKAICMSTVLVCLDKKPHLYIYFLGRSSKRDGKNSRLFAGLHCPIPVFN